MDEQNHMYVTSVEFREFRKQIGDSLDELRRAVSGIGRTDSKTVLAVLAVMLTGFGVLGGALTTVGALVVRPVIEDIASQGQSIEILNKRADDNRLLTIRAFEILRAVAVEHETQIGAVEAVAAKDLQTLYLQENTWRRARGEPELPMPDFTIRVTHRVPVPGLFQSN